jgi:hypothetical protein
VVALFVVFTQDLLQRHDDLPKMASGCMIARSSQKIVRGDRCYARGLGVILKCSKLYWLFFDLLDQVRAKKIFNKKNWNLLATVSGQK